MNTYLIAAKSQDWKLLFKYNENGDLMEFKCEDHNIPHDHIAWFYPRFPFTEKFLDRLRVLTNITITKVIDDLSFKTFWDMYGYKVGKKERSEKLWKALSDLDKAAALAGIPKYKRWLSMGTTAMAYPETYLSQRRWENEYR